MTFFVFLLAVGCSFIPIESVFYSFHGPSWYVSVLFVFYIIGYFITKRIKNRNTNKPIIWLGGILLCELMPQIQKRIQSLNKDLLEIVALIVFVGFFIVNNFASSSTWGAWVWFIPVSLLLIAFYKDDGVISSLFKRRFWQFLGNISFEVYMTHAFVYEGLPVAAGVVSGTMKSWIVYHAGTRFVITLIASIVFAWVVHIVFNSQKWKRIKRL